MRKKIYFIIIFIIIFPMLCFSNGIDFYGDIDTSYSKISNSGISNSGQFNNIYFDSVMNFEKKLPADDFIYSIQVNAFNSLPKNSSLRVIPYRAWYRHSFKKSELKLGLQKIVFGHARILRTLSLFDNIDPTDFNKRTSGSKAINFKYFPNDLYQINLWGIYNELENKKIHSGFRINRIIENGEYAFTYHKWNNDFNHLKEEIIGFDAFFDVKIGLWIEHSTHLLSSIPNYNLTTVGIDYTFSKIGNGLHTGIEYMYASDSDFNKTSDIGVFFWDIPLTDSKIFSGILVSDGGILQLREDVNDNLDAELSYSWFTGNSTIYTNAFQLNDHEVRLRFLYSF